MVLACFFSAAAGFNAPGAWLRHGSTTSFSLSGPALVPRLIGAPLMKLPGFGLNDREMARLSQMKRRDEPLEEEVRGLYVLGAAGGASMFKTPLARGHPPFAVARTRLLGATRWAREESPRACRRGKTAVALWCMPKVADSSDLSDEQPRSNLRGHPHSLS